MTIGLGIDLVEISRMEKAMENGHFLRRVFTEAERAYAEHGGNAAQHYAGMFAAKEAAAKAATEGTADRNTVPKRDIHASSSISERLRASIPERSCSLSTAISPAAAATVRGSVRI